jgi:hypothetical protein
MTNRADAQAAINALTAKQGTPNSITPTNLASDQLQEIVDNSLMIDEGTSSAWVNPFDNHTILPTDNRIDGFPDLGTPANATYTLQVASNYPVGWSCDIYNDTQQDWKIFINDSGANQLQEIFQGSGVNCRVNGAQDGFIFVAIKGAAPIVLDPATYGDFNNFTVWQKLTSPRFIMPNATAAQVSNFAPFMEFNGGGGIFYTFDIVMRNDVTGFLIEAIVTSTQDSANNGLARQYRRFGPDMPTSTANDWSTEAKREDLPLFFAVTSSDSISVSTDSANTTFFTGFSQYGPINGFTIDAATGSVINTSGRTVSSTTGTISVQPEKTGGGAAQQMRLWSEVSDDGLAWTINTNSLRTFEISADGETFKTSVSLYLDWLDGQYLRFKCYSTGGGALSLEPTADNVDGQAITGPSVIWNLKED